VASLKMGYTLSDKDRVGLQSDNETMQANANYNLSAACFFPLAKNSLVYAPIVIWNHGTTLEKDAVPSYAALNKPVFGYLNNAVTADKKYASTYIEASLAVSLAAQGFIVVMPDYMGQGADANNRLHPLIAYDYEARTVSSAIDATIKQFSDISPIRWDGRQIYIMGYSEGGYVTMSAAKYIQESRSDLLPYIKAVAPGGGPYNLDSVMKNVLLSDNPYQSPAYIEYMIFAYAEIYPAVVSVQNALQNLNVDFISTLQDKITKGVEGVDSINSYIESSLGVSHPNAVIKNTLSPSFIADLENNDSSISKLLVKNSVYNWQPQMNMRMFNCDNDELVSVQNLWSAYNSMPRTSNVNEVTISCPDASAFGGVHSAGFPFSVSYAIKYIKENSSK
jgi:hypothetical protein